MRRKNRKKVEDSALDLTPMMDIVFIMLIFFIVTTSFVKETGVDINRPNAETAERDEKGNILVAITQNNEIWIDKRRVDWKSVLQKKLFQSKRIPVFSINQDLFL